MTEKKRKIIRPVEGRMVAGVCLAFGKYLNIDPTIVRIFWAFLLIPGGIPGLLTYVICWIIIPSE